MGVDPARHDVGREGTHIEDEDWKSREPREVHIIKTVATPYVKYTRENMNKNFEVVVESCPT